MAKKRAALLYDRARSRAVWRSRTRWPMARSDTLSFTIPRADIDWNRRRTLFRRSSCSCCRSRSTLRSTTRCRRLAPPQRPLPGTPLALSERATRVCNALFCYSVCRCGVCCALLCAVACRSAPPQPSHGPKPQSFFSRLACRRRVAGGWRAAVSTLLVC